MTTSHLRKKARWLLPGTPSPLLVVWWHDEAATDTNLHVPSFSVIGRIDGWLVSRRRTLREIDGALAWGPDSGSSLSGRAGYDEQLKKRLTEAFRTGRLIALDAEQFSSARAQDASRRGIFDAVPLGQPVEDIPVFQTASLVPLEAERSSTVQLENARTPDPDNPYRAMTIEQRAEKIRSLLEEYLTDEAELLKVFQASASIGEFIALQEKVDMLAVLDELTDWQAIKLGALGPVSSGQELLNEKRANYIVEATQDYSPVRAQLFILHMFNNMFGDDIQEVLKKLSQEKRLSQTLLKMDAIKTQLEARGIDIARYPDREFELWTDATRATGEAIGDFLSSGELAQSATSLRYYSERSDLPQEYQDVLSKIDLELLKQAFSPGNLALGLIDQVTLGLYSLVTGTLHGLEELCTGDTEQGIKELVPSLLFVLSALGVKAYRAASGAAPGPSKQFVLKGYSGPLNAQAARLGSLLKLNGEAQGAAGLVLERYGQQGVNTLSGYMRADSKITRFIYQHGIQAIDALLETKGNLTAARARLPLKTVGQLPQYTQSTAALRQTALQNLTRAKVPENLIKQTFDYAQKAGIEREVFELVGSGKLKNPRGLSRFLKDLHVERSDVTNPRSGKYHQFQEAHERALKKHEVSLEGYKLDPKDKLSGQADIIDHTTQEAIQMKAVSGKHPRAVMDNLQGAVDQLSGARGEQPPIGYRRIADIRLEPTSPLYKATRQELLLELRGRIKNLDALDPTEAKPGIVRITNEHGTLTFTSDDLR